MTTRNDSLKNALRKHHLLYWHHISTWPHRPSHSHKSDCIDSTVSCENNIFFSSEVVGGVYVSAGVVEVVTFQEERGGARGSRRHIIHLHLRPQPPKCFKPAWEARFNI